MRKKLHLFLTALFVFFSVAAFPQQLQKSSLAGENVKKPHKIDARPFLDRIDAKVRQELGSSPILPQKNVEGTKEAEWSFVVGSTKTWYAVDMTTNEFYNVPSTCQAVGTNCYIFVQNSIWNTKVTPAAVNSVKNAFDSQTPANPTKGIYQVDVENFGNPPNVDSDSKIIILILDILDGYDGGGYVAGYFHGHNETTLANSNRAEIFYLDADPLDLTQAWGVQEGMSTTAHEFQHMIHYNYNSNQTTFFNEGCSMVAEYLCGYGTREQSSYSKETNHYLLDWRSDDNVLTDYSRAFRFMFYYYDQFGAGILKNFVQSSLTGISGINDALSKVSPATDIRFPILFENWLIANIVNNRTVNPLFGYNYPGLDLASGIKHINPNVPTTTISVARLGAQYLHFDSGKNLSIRFNAQYTTNFKIYAVQTGPSNIDIYPVNFDADYTVADFGSKYTSIVFVIINKSQTTNYSFSYTSTGEVTQSVVELKYDDTEPTGYLPSPAGDSVAVVFNAVAGGKIDSIKVAVRRTGIIGGGIHKASSVGNSPLGAKMASITGNSTQTPPVPYPVPWPNWITMDVSHLNLSSNDKFAVSIGCTGTSSAGNRVMVTGYPGSSSHNSFHFDSGTGTWKYYGYDGDGDTEIDSVYLYLIRAYVTLGSIGNEKEIIELAPVEYELAQNYPNPFNPSTTINFTIPQNNNVVIEIFNITGQKIKTLVNDYYASGSHKAVWNGINDNGEKVSSGIYFYTIKAGAYFKTNKMTLLK